MCLDFRGHQLRWPVLLGVAAIASACSSSPSETTVDHTSSPDVGTQLGWNLDSGTIGGGQDRAVVAHDLGAAEEGSTGAVLERVLGYVGSSGQTNWVHVVARVAGSNSVSVRTVKMNPAHTPPFDSAKTLNIASGETKTAEFEGKTGGLDYVTTVSYRLSGDDLTISHSSIIDGNASGNEQTHGVVSLAADAALPYKRSLHYVGTGSSEWLHIATRTDKGTVDVRTIRYNANLDSPVFDHKLRHIPADDCATDDIVGTFVDGGSAFTTELRYCRSENDLAIDHRSSSRGDFGDWQQHGDVPID